MCKKHSAFRNLSYLTFGDKISIWSKNSFVSVVLVEKEKKESMLFIYLTDIREWFCPPRHISGVDLDLNVGIGNYFKKISWKDFSFCTARTVKFFYLLFQSS